ncbi:MAG: thioredoxin [Pseudomonadales bacterium]
MNTATRTTEPRVFEATAESFERDVVLKSQQVPVLVDFWATWCGPCKSLGPILDKLAEDYGGAFVLAKVDVDQQQELAGYFQIRSVPTVMLLKDAKVVAGFPGALPEGQIRSFLAEHGVEPLAGGDDAEPAVDAEPADPAALVEQRRAALATEPDQPERRLDLALALVTAREFIEAKQIIDDLPANLGTDARTTRALSRIRLEQAVADAPALADLERQVETRPDDLAARHQLGARLVLTGQAERGLELLLELLRRDRSYADGLPRQALVDAFNVVDDPDLVRTVRRRMTALLF